MIKNFRVAIVTHTFATGPAQELEAWLKDKVKELIFIGHPFSYCKIINSVYKKYQKGKLVKEKKAYSWHLHGVLMYLKDMFYTFFWLLFSEGVFDLCIGSDNLNAFTGILLKKIGKVKKVIFYTIDYVPYRFENETLNKIYHWVDRYCLKNADIVWNLSQAMTDAREKNGVSRIYRDKQIIVPHGTHLNVIKLPFNKINRFEIGFMGHLREGQGVEVLIKAMVDITKAIPKAKLVLIGAGPLEEDLKKQAKNLSVLDKIEFTGFIESHRDLENRLAKCALAVAPYIFQPKGFSQYCDPGKPKVYLATGLPVIITKVPPFAQTIEKEKAGLAIEEGEKALAKAVVEILKNDRQLKEYKKNAIQLAKKYDWEKVFREALEKTL